MQRANCVARFRSSSAPSMYSSKTSFLHGAPCQHEDQPGVQFAFANVQPIFLGQQLRYAQRTAARNDRHLVQTIGARHDPRQQRIARFRGRRSFLFPCRSGLPRRWAPSGPCRGRTSKSSIVTLSLPWRMAHSAASLTRLRMSAPVRPTVPPAMRSRSTSSASGTSRE